MKFAYVTFTATYKASKRCYCALCAREIEEQFVQTAVHTTSTTVFGVSPNQVLSQFEKVIFDIEQNIMLQIVEFHIMTSLLSCLKIFITNFD